jgi:hypothetical protein
LRKAPGHAGWIALLLVLILALFRELATGREVLYQRDIQAVWYGQAATFARCIRSGAWPVWDPTTAFGRPFLANPSTQVLYPGAWLSLVLTPEAAYALYALSHLALTAIGFYALGLQLGQSRLAATTAAAAWSLSGPLLSSVSLWHHFAGACWAPWVVLAAERALSAPRGRRFVALGFVLAAQILAGSAEMCALTVLLLAALAATRARWRSPWGDGLRPLAGMALAGAIASGVTAPLWLPALEVLRRSPRWGLDEAARTFWSVHPGSLLQVAFPLLPGSLPLNVTTKLALYEGREPFLDSLYLGVVALPIATLALLAPRRPRARLYAATGLLALFVALGKHLPLYGALLSLLPPLAIVRFPSKVMVAVAFATAILVGFGVDRCRSPASPRSFRAVAALSALLAAGAAAGAMACTLAADSLGRAFLEPGAVPGGLEAVLASTCHRLWMAAVLAALAVLLLAWRALASGRERPWPAVGVAMLVILDLFAAHRGLNPTAPAGTTSRPPAVLESLGNETPRRIHVFDYEYVFAGKPYRRRRDLKDVVLHPLYPLPRELARNLSLQEYLLFPTSRRWGLYGSYDLDLLRLYPDSLKRATLFIRGVEETPAFLRLLQAGGVHYVLALHDEGLEGLEKVTSIAGVFSEAIRVFRVPGSLPYAYAVGGTRVERGLPALRLLASPNFDPGREVILPSGSATLSPAGFTGTVTPVASRADRIRLDVDLSHDGFVVVLDGDDPGWRATVDNRPAAVLTANELFRAVSCPSGHHQVEFVYHPTGLRAGLGVALLTVALVAGTAIGLRLRSHR